MFRKTILLLILFGISYGQSPDRRSGLFSNNRFGNSMGFFMNAGDDQIEFDGFLETETNFGIYGNIWLSQIDFDEDTNIELNTTIGYTTKLNNSAVLGLGYTKYSHIGDKVAEKGYDKDEDDLEEVFLGADAGSVTFAVFYEPDSRITDFLGIVDLNDGPLFDLPLDISLLGFIEKDNYELNITASKIFQNNLSLGYIFSWEKYVYDETNYYYKDGQSYSETYRYGYKGFFNTIYIGFVF